MSRRLGAFAGLAAALPGLAGAPGLDHIFPAAVCPGSTNTVTLVGKFEPWPPKFWIDGTGVTIDTTTNSGVVTVTVATNAPAGARFVRAFNDEGGSAPRFLIVTPEPQTAEAEPNNEWKAPQRIASLPATVNGRLEKGGDLDSFAVSLRAGQTLVAWLEAYTLMSPLDPVLRLVNSRGLQVSWNHDEVRSLDPFLAWTAPADGEYVVQVFGFNYPADSDIRFAGNARGVYRLHLEGGPRATHTLPLGVRRGSVTLLRLKGWNLPGDGNAEVPFDGNGVESREETVAFLPPGTRQTLNLPVGDGPERMETEPNSTRESAQDVEVPSAITGTLDTAGDEDRFTFTAKQGQAVTIELQAAALGFPLDAWLRVEDGSGKSLADNDDALGPDPRLDWSAPADGTFVVVVGNRLRGGGRNQYYHLVLKPSVPSIRATVADHAFTLTPGKTNDLKVVLTRRNGFSAPVTVSAVGLPDGVTAAPVEVSNQGGEATLQLLAATNAPVFGGPFQVRLVGKEPGLDAWAVHSLVSTGENNGVPQGYRRLVRETLTHLWLTVLRPPSGTNSP